MVPVSQCWTPAGDLLIGCDGGQLLKVRTFVIFLRGCVCNDLLFDCNFCKSRLAHQLVSVLLLRLELSEVVLSHIFCSSISG